MGNFVVRQKNIDYSARTIKLKQINKKQIKKIHGKSGNLNVEIKTKKKT